MTREQYEGIVRGAPDKLTENLAELEDRVIEAAGEALSATQDTEDGGNPKVRISLKVVIDLSQSPPVWHTEGAVGITFRVKSDAEQCDETPELLPGIGKGKKPKTPKGKAIERFFDAVEDLQKKGVTTTLESNEIKLKK